MKRRVEVSTRKKVRQDCSKNFSRKAQRPKGEPKKDLCVFAPLREKFLTLYCVAEAVADRQDFGDELRVVDEVAIELSQRHR